MRNANQERGMMPARGAFIFDRRKKARDRDVTFSCTLQSSPNCESWNRMADFLLLSSKPVLRRLCTYYLMQTDKLGHALFLGIAGIRFCKLVEKTWRWRSLLASERTYVRMYVRIITLSLAVEEARLPGSGRPIIGVIVLASSPPTNYDDIQYQVLENGRWYLTSAARPVPLSPHPRRNGI